MSKNAGFYRRATPETPAQRVACWMREFASRSQQIPPALLACHSDAQSFQMLFHLLPTLLHGVLREEISDIGFKLGTD
jgi:hypothetical protein